MIRFPFFFFNDTATTEIYTLSLHDALPISPDPFFMYLAPATPHGPFKPAPRHEDEYPDAEAPRPPSFDEPDVDDKPEWVQDRKSTRLNSSHANISYAVFCLKKKK